MLDQRHLRVSSVLGGSSLISMSSAGDLNPSSPPRIKPPPIIHLKSKSTPEDKWQTHFESLGGPPPLFIPPLIISSVPSNCSLLKSDLQDLATFSQRWGGIILTSRRAVQQVGNALAGIRSSTGHDNYYEHRGVSLTVFVVGPATEAAISSLISQYSLPWTVEGGETGNSAALAENILSHYSTLDTRTPSDSTPTQTSTGFIDPPAPLQVDGTQRKPLLYLVGETHDASFTEKLRSAEPPIPVTELVVYASVEDEGFDSKLRRAVNGYAKLIKAEGGSLPELEAGEEGETWVRAAPSTSVSVPECTKREGTDLWVIAWAPSGISMMLRALGWLEPSGRGNSQDISSCAATERSLHAAYDPALRREQARALGVSIRCAAIGPKTAHVAMEKHGFEFDCVAAKPTVEALWEGIRLSI
jgi:uroporphyrinogen-III synthase